MGLTKKNDFIALRFTGSANGHVFDSNNPEDLADAKQKAEAKPVLVVVGQSMVVHGLDKALEGKEVGKTYEITLKPGEGFGERRKELVKTIPLKVFTERKIMPQPGMLLNLDDMLVKIVAVSGARVITDFNNPLAGKEVQYTFTILREVTDEAERVRALCEALFKFVPAFDIGETITIKGEKFLEVYVKAFGPTFKELLGKELQFSETQKAAATSDQSKE